MTITVAQGWTGVEDIVKNIADVTDTRKIRLANIVNRQLYDQLIDIAPDTNVTSYSLNVSVGTATYALPSGFRDTIGYGCGLYKVNNGVDTDQMLPRTAFGSSKYGYYIDGNNIVMTPVPTNVDTLVLRYIPDLADLTTTAGTFCVPDDQRWFELVRQGLLVEYYKFKRDMVNKQMAEADYAAMMDHFAEKVGKKPLSYPVIDISSLY